jgi:hypothetical protein
MDGLDGEQLTAAERRSEPGAGVALRVARLAGTPPTPKSRRSEHGRLRACELAVRDAPCRVSRRVGRRPVCHTDRWLRRRRLAVPTRQSPLQTATPAALEGRDVFGMASFSHAVDAQ